MRRCPHCQAPNPEASLFCQRCGQPLPRVEHEAFWAWSDWFEPATLRAALVPLFALLVFRVSFGGLLSVGSGRVEARFLTFHLLHGLIFGAGVAWVAGDVERGKTARWALLGLLAGLFTEALEYWYTYQHVMQGVVFKIVDWFGALNTAALVPYRSLQVLRLLGVVGPLSVAWALWTRPRPGQVLALLVWGAAGLYLRALVLGYPLNWSGIQTPLSLKNLALYAFSALLWLYALGAREKNLKRLTPSA